MEIFSTEIQMAPFQGITTSVFRKVYAKHFTGVDKMFTPFFTNVYKEGLNRRGEDELKDITLNGIPVVPQILSKDPEEILRFAEFVKSLGYDEVNWNLGCPFPRVAKKKRGSGMLPYPGEIRKILDEVFKKIPLKFSIKSRLGYETPSEILKVVEVINDYPVSELTVHARIGKQLYKGDVNTDLFPEILKLSRIRVGFNGDIFNREDFIRIKEKVDVDLIMLGRGLLVDPLLPGKIKKSDTGDETFRVGKFIEDLYFQYRKKFNDSLTALNVLKELWWYLSHSFSNPHKVFKTLKKTRSFDEYEDAVKLILDKFEWVGSEAGLFRISKIEK